MVFFEAALVILIMVGFYASTFFIDPVHMDHDPVRARLGALIHGAFLGVLIGFVLLPLRLTFFSGQTLDPNDARTQFAALALIPIFVLLVVIRRGLLARAPFLGRYVRAYRKATLRGQIAGAQKVIARLDALDLKGMKGAPA